MLTSLCLVLRNLWYFYFIVTLFSGITVCLIPFWLGFRGIMTQWMLDLRMLMATFLWCQGVMMSSMSQVTGCLQVQLKRWDALNHRICEASESDQFTKRFKEEEGFHNFVTHSKHSEMKSSLLSVFFCLLVVLFVVFNQAIMTGDIFPIDSIFPFFRGFVLLYLTRSSWLVIFSPLWYLYICVVLFWLTGHHDQWGHCGGGGGGDTGHPQGTDPPGAVCPQTWYQHWFIIPVFITKHSYWHLLKYFVN